MECLRKQFTIPEEKLQRVGQLATEIETLKNELEDTKERLVEDTEALSWLLPA